MKSWSVTYWLMLIAAALAVTFFFGRGTVHKVALSGSEASFSSSNSKQIHPAARPASKDTTRKYSGSKQSRLKAGEHFDSLNDLVNDQLLEGFVRVGLFGNHWPASVSEIATDRNGISFVRQDGIRHSYGKFQGYRMKMVRLKAGRKETIVVFRSQNRG